MRLLIAGICLLFGLTFFLKAHPILGMYAGLAQSFFLPWLAVFFLLIAWMNPLFYRKLELPPIQVFILSMVIKMMLGLALLLIYLINGLGPQNEGAWTFMALYIILEILEIIRFLSILRPDSRR